MNEVIEKEEIKIENMIYEIRGNFVMIDRDLAYLYQTETRILNQRVKRNIERFPNNFCFQMNEEEFKIWKSQNVISKRFLFSINKRRIFKFSKVPKWNLRIRTRKIQQIFTICIY